MNYRTGVVRVGWQFGVWLCSPLGQQHTANCTPLYKYIQTWRLPGLSRGFVDRFSKLTTDRKQKTCFRRNEQFYGELLPKFAPNSVYRVALATKNIGCQEVNLKLQGWPRVFPILSLGTRAVLDGDNFHICIYICM